jgi:uncharacterized membrane protein HdeD (DUF308 family)
MPENTSNKGPDETRRSWAWFLSLGVAFIILGLIGFIHALTAAITSVSLFGWLLLFGGLIELIPSFRKGTLSGYPFYALDMSFRAVAGLLFITYPTMTPAALKLLVATFLVVVGLSRAIGAGMAKFTHYGWAVSSGVLTTILGCIAMGYCSFWFAGFSIGLDLIFGGVAMIAFGSGVHGTPRRTVYRPA